MMRAVKKRARAEHPEAHVIVQEFSPMQPGFNVWFQQVILPDMAVVTSVTSGRMRVEHTVDEVASEMLTLANNARFAAINRDDIDGRFAAFLTNPQMTTEFAEDLDKIRSAGDFNDKSLGLLIGAVLSDDFAGKAKAINLAAAEMGVMVLIAGANVVRFAPALNISEQEVKLGMARFAEVCESLVRGSTS